MGIGWADAVALATVVAIDITMAGDNALVVGMAAAGLPRSMRRRAVLLGIGTAAALRILFAAFTVRLLAIGGLTVAGGLLLLWVAWKLWREISNGENSAGQDAFVDGESKASARGGPTKTMRQAVTQIVVADVSMSLDNVLAVAGAAREHFWVLVAGLGLSVGLMGIAAGLVARLISRQRWIAYGGLLIILYVALSMIWQGTRTVISAADGVLLR